MTSTLSLAGIEVGAAIDIFMGGRADQRELRALVRRDPVGAIQHVQANGDAEMLDVVIGAIGNDRVSAELIEAHMVPELVVELIASRAELDSAAALIVKKELLIQALGENINPEENGGTGYNLYFLRSWALRTKDRRDWDKILKLEVAGRTVFDWLIYACWVIAEQPDLESLFFLADAEHDGDSLETEDLDDESSAEEAELASTDRQRLQSMFNSLGLDPIEAEERLRELDEAEELHRFSEEDLLEARTAYETERASRTNASKAAEDVAKGLDLGE